MEKCYVWNSTVTRNDIIFWLTISLRKDTLPNPWVMAVTIQVKFSSEVFSTKPFRICSYFEQIIRRMEIDLL
jgi:hypothetical protein